MGLAEGAEGRAASPAPAPTRLRRGAEGRAALAVATLSSFLIPFSGSATHVALPAVGRELHLDAVSLSWIANAYLLSASVFLVPSGRLADIHGRRRFFVWGLFLYSTTSLLSALAPSAALLLLARVAQGAGGAMIFATAVAVLTSVFPPGRWGAALGTNAAAVYLGLSLGPSLGGLLTQALGWRSVFHASALLGAFAAAAAALWLRREWAPARGEPIDVAGCALYGIGVAALGYGLGRLPGALPAALVAGGLALLLAFAAWEQRTPHPVLEVALFRRNRVFALSNLAALINYAATFAVGFLLSLHLQTVLGLAAGTAGAVLMVQPLAQAAVSPVAGRLSDRIDPRPLASAGMALVAAGLALLALVREATPLGFVVACLVVLGVGFGAFSAPNTNAVMGSVEDRLHGVASATLATMRLVGQMLSMGMAGSVLAAFLGREPLTPARHAAFVAAQRTAFGLFAVLCAAGVFASLARGDGLRRDRPD
jgi:EmrB/QacA subfamily drug resistance transporter